MLRVALTGSIAMGKSTTARMFADLGCPVFDSDAAVHALYDTGGAAVPVIEALFADAVVDGRVDRQRLSEIVLKDADALARLEAAVHPLVHQAQKEKLQQKVLHPLKVQLQQKVLHQQKMQVKKHQLKMQVKQHQLKMTKAEQKNR